MEKIENCIIIIFGSTGDLTKRKLIPALFNLYRQKLLPDKFAILGLGRSEFNLADFRDKLLKDVKEFCSKQPVESDLIKNFIENIFYHHIDIENSADYPALKKQIESLNEEKNIGGNYLYYLAIPPSLYESTATKLGEVNLNFQNSNSGWKRIVIEKPFGYDLNSARKLNINLQKIFKEDQIYRIDHYLGKETVQNVLAFRFANGIYEPLWNRNYIHHIEITAAEKTGIENRGGYYDTSGALRDMVQNHLLQLVGLVAMEPPSVFNSTALRNETVKIFESICPIRTEDISKQVVRGQYMASTVKGQKIKGYREENKVRPNSKTETFVAMKFYIDNWRWGGVPFYLRTGKQLPTRVTEIVIHFERTPHRLFTRQFPGQIDDNQLVIRIQPDEGILIKFGMKLPGAGFKIKNVNMDFHYSDMTNVYIPEAYERLLLDCILGDQTLYARSDAVEACWKFITPIIEEWEKNSNIKIYGYPAGTWGPREASELFDDINEDWRYPCRNLTNDGEYCEL